MGETGIITTIVKAMGEFVVGSATAIGDGLKAVLFNVGTDGAVTGLSSTGSLLLTMLAIGFGIGLMYVIIGFIRVR